MPLCEYRITSEEAHRQASENFSHPLKSKMARGMVIAFLGPVKPVCQLFMNAPADTDGVISCVYPNASTESCPYAREAKRLPPLPAAQASQL